MAFLHVSRFAGQPKSAVVLRYGAAVVLVAMALGTALILRHDNLPHPSFTGAVSQRIGRLELADSGTLFLDEVGEIPLELPPKLLRVLQEREFERLGGTRTIRTDVRLIAATNRDLAAMVQSRSFALIFSFAYYKRISG